MLRPDRARHRLGRRQPAHSCQEDRLWVGHQRRQDVDLDGGLREGRPDLRPDGPRARLQGPRVLPGGHRPAGLQTPADRAQDGAARLGHRLDRPRRRGGARGRAARDDRGRVQGRDVLSGLRSLLGRRGVRRDLQGLRGGVGEVLQGARAVLPPDRQLPAGPGDDRRHGGQDRRLPHARVEGRVAQGQGPAEHPRDLDRQAPRDRGGGGMREHGDPGPRGRRLCRRPPCREVLPRRAGHHPVRGHLPDPETDHRPRDDGHQRPRPLLGCRSQAAMSEAQPAGSDSPETPDAGVGPAEVIGVLGAGTMGAGIAQLACRSGAITLLHDPIAEALERGVERVHDGLRREAARGRLSEQQAAEAADRLQPVEEMAAFAPCELVIEAVPERLELKHELYSSLQEIVGGECVLATNTSSLLVTAIASAVTDPGRVVGMHFFNPAPVMRLLEVVAGERSSPRALALAEATGEAMGKSVILASDGPGFLVNRCNRPFGLEALRLLQERLADIETIDRICRMEGGFPMGPFELMDLVGVDTGFEVSKSFYAQSFGEPRWRPSPITARYVAAGLHGRKTGRGYYDYSGTAPGGNYRSEDPGPTEATMSAGEGVVVISGSGSLATELRDAATAAGYEVRSPHAPSGGVLPSLAIDCASSPVEATGELEPGSGGAQLLLCARASLTRLNPGGSAVGFHALPPLADSRLVE